MVSVGNSYRINGNLLQVELNLNFLDAFLHFLILISEC